MTQRSAPEPTITQPFANPVYPDPAGGASDAIVDYRPFGGGVFKTDSASITETTIGGLATGSLPGGPTIPSGKAIVGEETLVSAFFTAATTTTTLEIYATVNAPEFIERYPPGLKVVGDFPDGVVSYDTSDTQVTYSVEVAQGEDAFLLMGLADGPAPNGLKVSQNQTAPDVASGWWVGSNTAPVAASIGIGADTVPFNYYGGGSSVILYGISTNNPNQTL